MRQKIARKFSQMNRILTIVFSLFLLSGIAFQAHADHHQEGHSTTAHDSHAQHGSEEGTHASGHEATSTNHEEAHGEGHHAETPTWLIIPFVGLLLMIATGPLFFEHFWHKNYPIVAFALALFVAVYYALALGDSDSVVHAAAEYIQFIALLAGLFMASGGILI